MFKKYPELEDLMVEAREDLLDQLENRAIEMINSADGNTQLLLHYLKSLGRSRGLGESIKQEIEVTKAPTLNINFDD